MEPEKRKRKLQKRSIETKEKIVDTAYQLFCSKGYFETSTNEIAKIAEISIGGLYAHYPDKDTIFMEILDRYNQSFIAALNKLSDEMLIHQFDPRIWLRRLIKDLIVLHQNSKELNKEIQILSFSKPEVAKIRKTQHEKIRQIMTHFLSNGKIEFKVDDLEAFSIILMGLLDVIVEQIVFSDHTVSDDRILHAGVDAMLRLLEG